MTTLHWIFQKVVFLHHLETTLLGKSPQIHILSSALSSFVWELQL